MKQPGKKQVKKLKEQARQAGSKANAPQRARVARAGEIGDEQAANVEGPRKAQPGLAGYPNYEEDSASKR